MVHFAYDCAHWSRQAFALGVIRPLLDAVEPGFQCVGTRWNQGFIMLWRGPSIRIVVLVF
jgi:hypothetical protein